RTRVLRRDGSGASARAIPIPRTSSWAAAAIRARSAVPLFDAMGHARRHQRVAAALPRAALAAWCARRTPEPHAHGAAHRIPQSLSVKSERIAIAVFDALRRA